MYMYVKEAITSACQLVQIQNKKYCSLYRTANVLSYAIGNMCNSLQAMAAAEWITVHD